jgi:beta-glucuronidase
MGRLLAWLAALAAFAFPAAAFAQDALLLPHPMLTSADMRDSLDLSGPWTWSIDPYRDGLGGFHGEPAGEGHRRWDDRDPEEVARQNPGALFEYDMRHSPTTLLPSSWVTQDPALRYYDKLVWYQRAFSVRREPGKRAFLRFGAVDYVAYVYLNGQFVGRHEGGFTPFAFDVTGLLRDGENRITIGADAERSADTVPPTVTDWETYGGVTRPVLLIQVPQTYVDDAWLRLTRDGRIAASVRLDGPAAAGRPVRVEIAALHFVMTGTTGPDGSWTATVPAPRGLRLWSPESPTLYDVRFAAGEDVLPDRIGLRTIEVRGEDIILNGRPIFLRGICLHEEELGENPSRTITPAAARALLTEARDGLHANFVRLAHYPHSEVTTRMADELGLLVWSEIPVYWRVDFARPETLALARRMLAENIARDRNRASIILWSVGNETPQGEARLAFLRALVRDVRALDDSRLVTAALLSRREGNVQTIDDPLTGDLDVMAVNTYNGWYGNDRLADLAAIDWRSDQHKPLIFSELGAEALAGFHDLSASPRKFSEEYQAEYYRQTLAMADRIPFLRGMSPWILKDFRSPRRQNPLYQQGWNRKGLISETGRRKLAFGVLAEHYRRRALAPLRAH